MSDVVLKNITKFQGGHKLIDRLSLEIRAGEFVTLLGPSGSGKTTLLRMIAGLTTIEHGDLYIGGRRHNDVPAQRRRIAMVFQSYALFPHMSVKDNILFGLKIRKTPHHDMFDKLTWVVPLLGLQGLEGRLPREISGGQRQRVALARALVLDPEVLLLDEPLSNLDAALRETAMEELKRVHRQVGKTILYVTHNQAEAMSMSERIAILNMGRVEQYDTPRAVYDGPRTVFAAQFIGSPSINILDGHIGTNGDVVGVETAIGFLALDKERGRRGERMAGKRVIVGIRPQGIHYAAHSAARRHTDTRVELTIDLVESQGDRTLVVARAANDTAVRFLVMRDDDLESGARVEALVDGRRLHAFDPETRANVFS